MKLFYAHSQNSNVEVSVYNVQGQFQFKKKLSWPTNRPQREPRADPINKEVANIKVKK